MTKIYLLLVLTVIVFACKPDENPSKKELVSKSWKIKSVTINGVADNTTDYSSWTLKFTNDGTYLFTMGSNTETGTWALNAAETQIILNGGTSTEKTYTLLSINKSFLDFETTIPATFKEGEKVYVYSLIP
jgi:hypothetical protein